MSRSGFLDDAPELLDMLTQAIKAGYASALTAVEAGDYDDKIWHSRRSELFE